jgi:Secretion system C-terminal sorting domain
MYSQLMPVARAMTTVPVSLLIRMLTSAGGSDAFIVRLRKETAGIPVEKPTAQEDPLYPNPARIVLYLNPGASLGEISIVDLNGIIRIRARSEKVIDVSNLNPGTYFLRSADRTRKFLKID